jgi:hypothetical protein
MVLTDGGALITTMAQTVTASGYPTPNLPARTGAASPEPVPPVAPAPGSQSALSFSLLIEQNSDRLIMEWNDRASGLLVLQIPVKTAAQALAGSSDSTPHGKRVNSLV